MKSVWFIGDQDPASGSYNVLGYREFENNGRENGGTGKTQKGNEGERIFIKDLVFAVMAWIQMPQRSMSRMVE